MIRIARRVCPAAVQVYTGTMYAMPASITLGAFAASATHRYQFTVNFPDSGTGGADNAYQGGVDDSRVRLGLDELSEASGGNDEQATKHAADRGQARLQR